MEIRKYMYNRWPRSCYLLMDGWTWVLPFDDLNFLSAEAERRRGKLTSVGKIGRKSQNSCFLRAWESYAKEEFDLIFWALPELEASNFVFGFWEKRDASGLVMRFLDNYRRAENTRRLHVILFYENDVRPGHPVRIGEPSFGCSEILGGSRRRSPEFSRPRRSPTIYR